MIKEVFKKITKCKNPKRAESSRWFFKTGPGQYGEGDIFIGIKSADMRSIAKKYKDLKLSDIQKLLKSKIHEERQVALLILIEQFKIQENQKKIVKFYLKNTNYINNWDLVDLSAPKILGDYLIDKPKDILYKFAKSDNLWKKRIAVISTYAFIRKNQLKDTLRISEILLKDKHDLIHKATGWMLREVGKKDMKILRKFLDKNISKMPRTMLRYAIEKFPENIRLKYLKKEKQIKIMVFGTFDGFHKGHLNFFKQAKKLAKNSFLIVSVARDKNVKIIKKNIPFLNERKRMALIRKYVLIDKVVLSGINNYILHIIKETPDIIALGYDQKHYVKNLKKDLKDKGLFPKIVRLKPYKEKVLKNRLLNKRKKV